LAAMHDITGSFGDVLQRQLELAAQNYEFLKGKGVRAINVMGAIGSGKTELIVRMAEKLRERGFRVGAIAGDVAGDDDYQRFRAAAFPPSRSIPAINATWMPTRSATPSRTSPWTR
jgi:hydrogenase nickel incorporation protein HypB